MLGLHILQNLPVLQCNSCLYATCFEFGDFACDFTHSFTNICNSDAGSPHSSKFTCATMQFLFEPSQLQNLPSVSVYMHRLPFTFPISDINITKNNNAAPNFIIFAISDSTRI